MIRKTYKFRLYPNRDQERELNLTLETHRRLYNAVLDGKQLCWETAGVNWSWFDQYKWLKYQRQTHPWYSKLNCHSAMLTLKRLDNAYKNFFKKGGFPRFKSREAFTSFTFDIGNKGGGCKIVNEKLRLQNIGTIRVKWHRQIPSEAKLKQCDIVRDNDRWYAHFVVEEPDPPEHASSECVGIDLGLRSFITTSDGETIGNPRILEQNLQKIRRASRALSRCKKGSNRRKKVKKKLRNLHEKVRNTRKDEHHKISRSLVNRFGYIAAERLNIKGMLKNRRLSRQIIDAGWGNFIIILARKAESAGGKLILVDPKYTSQMCSQCGVLVEKKLSVRIHKCECGLTIDRDVNAARNILVGAQPEIDKLSHPTT